LHTDFCADSVPGSGRARSADGGSRRRLLLNETRTFSTRFKWRASVCAVAAATSIAELLAVVASSAAATGSSDLPGNTKIGSAKFRRLLLGCSSALAVSLLTSLAPELQPLLETSAKRSVNRSTTEPRILALNRN
jgi:hypothetical protein